MASSRKIINLTLAAARAFGRCEDGGPASEFASLMPIFAGLIFLIAQVGLYLYYSTYLHYVTQYAAREIFTGNVANQDVTTTAQFQTNVLCPRLPGSMSCNNIITNIQVVPEASKPAGFYALMNYMTSTTSTLGYTMTGLAAVSMNNNNTSYCIGTPGAVVALEVYYAMPVLGIPSSLGIASTYNGQSVIFISATAAFKNEPYTTSYAGC